MKCRGIGDLYPWFKNAYQIKLMIPINIFFISKEQNIKMIFKVKCKGWVTNINLLSLRLIKYEVL